MKASQFPQGKPIELAAVGIYIEIDDHQDGARVTDGELLFENEYEPILREMSKDILEDDGHTIQQVYNIRISNWIYTFEGLGISEPVVDPEHDNLLLVKFSTWDLKAVGPAKPQKEIGK